MGNRKVRDTLIAGLTLFAMFLGAGNVIFPPYVGVMAGGKWMLAALGFILTAAGLPLLGTLAIARLGGAPDKLCARAWPKMSVVLNILILVMIGPLFAIPRTAATTTEMSVLPFLPAGTDVKTVCALVSIVFFALTYMLSISESRVMDAIGGVLSPLLVLFLILSIGLSIFKPTGTPVENTVQGSLFYYGFSSGYQTMDGIGSLVMSGTIAAFIAQKGYSEKEGRSMLLRSAIIAAALLGSVYAGYTWIGASGSASLRAFTSRTAMLSHASLMLSGRYGQILLALIIFFACLTTASGLTVTFAQYFSHLTKGRVSYKLLCALVVAVSFGISLIGVEGIISLSVPVLEVIYPLCIVLIALNLMGKYIKSDSAFRGAVVGTLLVCAVLAMRAIAPLKPLGDRIMAMLPLGSSGFGYVVPALVGFMVGRIGDRPHSGFKNADSRTAC